jgi:hypothetical protein
MAGRQPAPRRADVLEDMKAWLRAQQGRAVEFGHELEVAGRAAADRASRTGRSLVSGRRGGAPQTGRPAKVSPGRQASANQRGGGARLPAAGRSPIQVVAREAGAQTSAGLRGAWDGLTLGAGDHVTAGGGAVLDAVRGANLRDAYQQRFAKERASDQYDAQHYKAARTVGEIAGTGAGLLALGPLDGVLIGGARMARVAPRFVRRVSGLLGESAGGVRMAKTTPITARELTSLSAAGAGGGVVAQGVEDIGRGRIGTPGDYVGSALGGVATAHASLRGAPAQAAALGGATASLAQDAMNGRTIDVLGAGRTALASGLVAAPFGYAGRRYSDGLSITQKGDLGEALGRIRTRANWDNPLPGKPRLPTVGGHTVVDHETGRGLFTEQKFGRSHRDLKGRQLEAYNEYGDLYRVDHWLPRDIGAAIAFPFGLLGPRLITEDGSDR